LTLFNCICSKDFYGKSIESSYLLLNKGAALIGDFSKWEEIRCKKVRMVISYQVELEDGVYNINSVFSQNRVLNRIMGGRRRPLCNRY